MKKIGFGKAAMRVMCLALIAVLAAGMMADLAVQASAATLPDVSYAYSTEVYAGTIRYISQNDGKTNNAPRSGYFDDRYWGDYWLEPHYELACSGPGAECGTASISMALSYVGINKTPQSILDAHNGQTTFEGWGAELQYPNLSDAMDRLARGNGKYSPAIIHFANGAPGYPNGHYVNVIGKSGNTYSILDCNRDTVWSLSTGDTLYGYIDSVMQYYNQNAVIRPKISIPSNVTPTNLKLKVTPSKGAVIRTGSAKTYSVVRRAKKNETLTAVGYTWNNKNNLWYYLEDGTYIYSGNVKISQYVSTATLSGVAAPSGTIYAGNVFILKGFISGSNVRTVTANIKNAAGQTVLTASDVVSGTYSLQNSPIDYAMTFNTLGRGSYTYEIIVTESADTGSKCVSFSTVLWSSSFTVS